jgi:hypothetical protein
LNARREHNTAVGQKRQVLKEVYIPLVLEDTGFFEKEIFGYERYNRLNKGGNKPFPPLKTPWFCFNLKTQNQYLQVE